MKKLQIMAGMLSVLLLAAGPEYPQKPQEKIRRKQHLPMLPGPQRRRTGTNMLRRRQHRGRMKSPAFPTQLMDR